MRFRPAVLAFLALFATGALAAQAPAPSRNFQIILLAASQQGATSLQDLPASAQKALQDIRPFLPYKGYALADMSWLRSSGRTQAELKGPDGKGYHLSFEFSEVKSSAGKRLFIDSFTLDDLSAHPAFEPGRTPPPTASLISTSFDLQVGETVVVGVSKPDHGDHALIVLLTAVP